MSLPPGSNESRWDGSRHMVEGSMTKETFLQYLKFIVVSLSCADTILVANTAKVHGLSWSYECPHHGQCKDTSRRSCCWSHELFGMCFVSLWKAAVWLLLGVQIEYLPPYSPDLNPIEEAFSKIKNFICHHQSYYHEGERRDGFMFDMLEVMDIITLENAEDYYIHSGHL